MNLPDIKKATANGSNINRRQFIRMGLITTVSALVPKAVLASIDESPPPQRVMSLLNLYTNENIEAVYWEGGQYIPEALSEINYIFRDHRTEEMTDISPDLLDLLYSIQLKLKSKEPLQIVSGYRTPRSNALLRKIRRGVARNSLHMYGKAADIRLEGYSIKDIRHAALSCTAGGVGYYPRSNFVHVDVGLVRYWRG